MKSIGCVILAAGRSTRFASNKLTALLDGRPLFSHALELLPAERFAEIAVVTRFPAVAAAARARGFRVVQNSRPELGQSHSVALGTQALAACDAIVFLVADQPRLRRETVARLLDAWLAQPSCIVAAACQGRRGNPCIFPREFFPVLRALTGDRGGGVVIAANADRLRTIEVSPQELMDIDTVEALAALQANESEA